MRNTATETTETTLLRLIRAWDRRHPVTISYTRADGSDSIRTIEITDVTVSQAGDLLIRAMDRQSGEARSFRLDRISAYSVHRTAYRVAAPEHADPTTVTGLAAADHCACPVTDPAAQVEWLADLLTDAPAITPVLAA